MHNRKRILLVCGVFYPEPVVSARLQTDLAYKLAEHHIVTVLRPRPSRPFGFSFPEYDFATLPFKVIEIESYICPASSLIGRFRESISHGRWCANYIRRHHDEIDFVYNDSWHLFGVYLVAKVAKQFKIPYITPVQDVYPESLTSKLPNFKLLKWLVTRLLGHLDSYTLTHAACVQTNSDKLANYLSESRHLEIGHFIVVRNWQDERPFVENAKKQKQSAEQVPFTLMYMGNVGPLAGIELLFEAFAKSGLRNAKLVIAGSGPAKANLQRKAENYSCRIEFWDVPAGMVPETQAKADVMLLPVRKGYALYSVPSKLVAYMFSAKPIIACVDEDSDTAECIRVSRGGWVVKPEDMESLSKMIYEVAQMSSESRKVKGINGFNYAIEFFSKERNINILCKAIEQKLITN